MSLSHFPRNRKKLPIGLVAASTVVAALLSLSGCSGSSSSDGGSTTLSFYSWDNAETMKPVIAGFEAANSKIKVEVTYGTPVQGYISTLQTRLGSNTASDVFIITAENKVNIMDGGFAKDLSSEPFVSNLATAAKDAYTKNGKLYGVAVSSWGGGILYNKDLLAKVGFSAPPATWNDFLALCKKLSAAGIKPFYEGGDGIPVTLAALLGIENAAKGGTMDASIWSGETSFAKTWTGPLTDWSKLFTEGVEPRSVAGLTGDQVTTEFEKGSVAMITTGSWGLGGIKAAAPSLKLDFMAVPGDSSSYLAGAVSPGYAVNAKTKHLDAAVKFVTYLQSKAGVQAYQKQAAAITTTADFVPTIDPALATMVTAVRDDQFYMQTVSWPSNSAAMNSQTVPLLQQLIKGQSTPAQVAETMDANLKSLLAG